MHKAKTFRLMFSIATIDGTNSLFFLVKRISVFSKSCQMHRTKSEAFVWFFASINRTFKFCFKGFVCSPMFFKSLIMESTKPEAFVRSFTTNYRTFSFFTIMMAKMISIRRKKLKIFNSIVCGIFVNMVNYLFGGKFSFKGLFHNNSMFKFPNTILFYFNVQPLITVMRSSCPFWFGIKTLSVPEKQQGKPTAFGICCFPEVLRASFGIMPPTQFLRVYRDNRVTT